MNVTAAQESISDCSYGLSTLFLPIDVYREINNVYYLCQCIGDHTGVSICISRRSPRTCRKLQLVLCLYAIYAGPLQLLFSLGYIAVSFVTDVFWYFDFLLIV